MATRFASGRSQLVDELLIDFAVRRTDTNLGDC
jgi:hypothetical protein